MKISRIDIYKFNIPLIHEIVVPIGTLAAANNVAVRITTDSGHQGWREASPFTPITGDTQESIFENARLLTRTIMGKDPTAIDQTSTSWTWILPSTLKQTRCKAE